MEREGEGERQREDIFTVGHSGIKTSECFLFFISHDGPAGFWCTAKENSSIMTNLCLIQIERLTSVQLNRVCVCVCVCQKEVKSLVLVGVNMSDCRGRQCVSVAVFYWMSIRPSLLKYLFSFGSLFL